MLVAEGCRRGAGGHRTGEGVGGKTRLGPGVYWEGCHCCSCGCRACLGRVDLCLILSCHMPVCAGDFGGSDGPLVVIPARCFPGRMEAQEMEAPSRPHPRHAVVCHYEAGLMSGSGIDIWSGVVIGAYLGTCAGVRTCQARSDDADAASQETVRSDCPRCSPHS